MIDWLEEPTNWRVFIWSFSFGMIVFPKNKCTKCANVLVLLRWRCKSWWWNWCRNWSLNQLFVVVKNAFFVDRLFCIVSGKKDGSIKSARVAISTEKFVSPMKNLQFWIPVWYWPLRTVLRKKVERRLLFLSLRGRNRHVTRIGYFYDFVWLNQYKGGQDTMERLDGVSQRHEGALSEYNEWFDVIFWTGWNSLGRGWHVW